MIYSKIKLPLITVAIFIIAGCSQKTIDYSIHKPKVRYKPTLSSLSKLERQTYGRPYVWAAENNNCYDCSGLTYYTFGSMGVDIPRTADQQFHTGTPVSRYELQKGDLVFFGRRGRANHVGIYVGDDKFQHASSAKGRVIISSLNKPYYRRHYLGARRYYNFNHVQPFRPQMSVAYAEAKPVKQAPKVESSIQNIASSSVDSSKYYLKVGAFSSYPSELITKLELSGIQVATKSSNGQYIVLAGPYNSASEAQQDISYNYNLLANSTVIKGS